MLCMGMIRGGRKLYEQKEIKREEMMKAIANFKNDKAAVVDGITNEILIYRGK